MPNCKVGQKNIIFYLYIFGCVFIAKEVPQYFSEFYIACNEVIKMLFNNGCGNNNNFWWIIIIAAIVICCLCSDNTNTASNCCEPNPPCCC